MRAGDYERIINYYLPNKLVIKTRIKNPLIGATSLVRNYTAPIVLSSAKVRRCAYFMKYNRPFIKMLKSIGHRMDPMGDKRVEFGT